MQQITIKKITIKDKNKEGEPYVGKYGAYSLIFVEDTLGKIYSGFHNQTTRNYEVGQTIKIEITGDREFKGKTYYNFKPISQEEELKEEISDLRLRVKRLEDIVLQKNTTPDTIKLDNATPTPSFHQTKVDVPVMQEGEVNEEDIVKPNPQDDLPY
jgi:hypothetical protein